ncbi:hypothetical protein [Melissococcus plutonius]|uniref:hypothetical protein n=1 Tax=Melissococcus plutonius TaxID=33970 RepID=UPI003C2C8992
MNEQQRIASALESISKSLSSLAEDTKTNCELKKELMASLYKLEKMAEDPYGINDINE